MTEETKTEETKIEEEINKWLCIPQGKKSYRVEITQGWVKDDWFIFKYNNFFKYVSNYY